MIRQYYYKNPACPASRADDKNCICWHDEGTGPLASPETFISPVWWREKPDPTAEEVPETNTDLFERMDEHLYDLMSADPYAECGLLVNRMREAFGAEAVNKHKDFCRERMLSLNPNNTMATIKPRTEAEWDTLTAQLRKDLNAALDRERALLHFCEVEMGWEFFRAEFHIGDNPSQSKQNAMKIREFLKEKGGLKS